MSEPPPRRTHPTPTPTPTDHTAPTWKTKMKAKSNVWGKKAIDKSVVWSDNIGGRVNDIAEKRFGTEHFWPVTGDFPREMDKCARILRDFTVEGIPQEKTLEDPTTHQKKKIKVLRKIPPSVIKGCKGMAIFTSMRTGFAPFGGAGGAGLVVARLEDGSWSAPASISPNNLSAGFLLGVDVYDCVLIIRTLPALLSFSTHKATLGAEIGVAAGPYGAGAAVEAGLEKAPVLSYVKSRGLYAGVEVMGQVFVERFEENAGMYHWPGVKAGDILAGKVRVPPEAANLHAALRDAETGQAQARKNNGALDLPLSDGAAIAIQDLQLDEGEVMKLPPTPEMTDGGEGRNDPETEVVKRRSGVDIPGMDVGHVTESRRGSDGLIRGKGEILPPPRRVGGASGSGQALGIKSSGTVDPILDPFASGVSSPLGNAVSTSSAPPLPARSGNRPVLFQRQSSSSVYSDAVEGESDERGEIVPPGYHEVLGEGHGREHVGEKGSGASGLGVVSSGVGVGSTTQGEVTAGGVLNAAQGEEVMSESERKEWEQFLEDHNREQQTELDTLGGNDVPSSTGGLLPDVGVHGHGQESESLR